MKMNELRTTKEILAYKVWLESKDYAFLRLLNASFNKHKSMKTQTYPKLELRIDMLNAEIKKRLN